MKSMIELAKCLRALQLFYHNFHNNTKGASFFADHAFLGSAYGECEAQYDAVVEKVIGTGGDINLIEVNVDGAKLLKQLGAGDDESSFNRALMCENRVVMLCGNCDKEATSVGVKNLVGGIADESEARIYKLKQRLNKKGPKGAALIVVANKD